MHCRWSNGDARLKASGTNLSISPAEEILLTQRIIKRALEVLRVHQGDTEKYVCTVARGQLCDVMRCDHRRMAYTSRVARTHDGMSSVHVFFACREIYFVAALPSKAVRALSSIDCD